MVSFESNVEKVLWNKNIIETFCFSQNGDMLTCVGTHFVSSMPIKELVQKLDPPPPKDVVLAASNLEYRAFILVALIVNLENVFKDHWIYVHDPEVKVGRIQNFKNWSPHVVPDKSKTCLGLEYFCFEDDYLWKMTDVDLISLGTKELSNLGFCKEDDIEDGSVVRMPNAYPVYNDDYKDSLKILRKFFNNFDNLQLIGRNGTHKYNNQDHSMLTGMLAVDNILGANHDLWEVNSV